MKCNIFLLVFLTTALLLRSQAQPRNDDIAGFIQLLRDAERSSANKDWNAAVHQWENIVMINPTEGEFWYRLGESYYQLREFNKAIPAFDSSLRIGAPPPYEGAYFIAKTYAAIHNRSETLNWLQRSFDLGYRNIMSIPRDNSFKEYFNDERFKKITGQPLQPFKTRVEGWRFDLALMVREVKRRAPKPFRYISEKKFDSAVQAVWKKIPSLSDLQLIVEFEKILVLVGDGHTMIYAMFERPEFQKNLPVDFHFFAEGLFITEADKRYEDLLGTEVIAFDDHPLEDILKGMDPIINRDNELGPRIMAPLRMRTLPLLYGLGLVKDPNEVTLTVKDEQGAIKKILIKADCPIATRRLWDKLPENWITYSDHKKQQAVLYTQNKFTHYWFKYLEEDKTVYFQYNEIANDQDAPFDHFCDSLFAFIDTNDVRKLIIDMRWNHGGNTLLVPYLLDKMIACKKINSQGNLFGIIGGRAYSATINLLGYLERFTTMIFVGEPTGSSPNFVGEDDPFELPYSKLMANVSDLYWQTSWPTDHRQWYAPLIYIPATFKNFAAGQDPALDVILKYSNQPKK